MLNAHFLPRRTLLAAALGAAFVVAAPQPSLAQSSLPASPEATRDLFLPAEGDWETYVNGLYGMMISYPGSLFRPQDPPADGTGRRFVSPDAQLETFGWENTAGETPASLRERLIGTAGYEEVTYNEGGRGWLVLSGYRGDNVFYEKYMFRGGTIQAFGIEYPVAVRATYDPVLESIEDSFRAG